MSTGILETNVSEIQIVFIQENAYEIVVCQNGDHLFQGDELKNTKNMIITPSVYFSMTHQGKCHVSRPTSNSITFQD